jgi:surfeit locus 1 family protein
MPAANFRLECPALLKVEFGDCRLVASWWMTALTLIGVVLFALLGRWQWHRAEEKRAVNAQFAAGAADFSSELGHRPTAELPNYTQVRVHGRYEAAHQFLLDNMTQAGRAGYQVLTPFRLDDGRLLLVNRGWVPLPGERRDVLPGLDVTDTSEVNIGGRIDTLPVAGLALGQAAPSSDPIWPKRTSYPSMTQLSAALGQSLESRQLLLAPGEPQGYLRDWQAATGFPPERHVSYAVQWWGLGALSLFLYLFMNMECRR